ncbi:DUF1206 domain-containing protein [Actinomadura nitritigenes]|uniref:DUF1206 domain-containing protein n=1 Tax=Actinomadura nitritigenes TaxID=134602 RepID=A0ABS3QT24_9ACTN|nr:DUF1206 domain-containing protein [Actinomadura nitritigenes]MBO2437130.1 DUF1206 domain-containing protein [Actinomadura nitritigenes]
MTTNAADGMERAGRQVAGHKAFHVFCRSGLVARGVLYLLIGWLAVQIGLGDGGREADKQGALQTVADRPGGTAMLWLLAAGFAGLALWRFSEAAFGQPTADGRKATKRLASFGRGVFYSAGFATMLNFVLGQGGNSSNEQSKTYTARAMEHPGGRWLVLAVGVGFLAWGVGSVVGAVRRKFLERLNTGRMGPRTRTVVKTLGVVGRASRGVVFGGVGVFLGYAAVTFDPGKAKGLDGTLRQFAGTPAGPWLLIVVAAGLLVFGVYSFCEARWRKVEAVRNGVRGRRRTGRRRGGARRLLPQVR